MDWLEPTAKWLWKVQSMTVGELLYVLLGGLTIWLLMQRRVAALKNSHKEEISEDDKRTVELTRNYDARIASLKEDQKAQQNNFDKFIEKQDKAFDKLIETRQKVDEQRKKEADAEWREVTETFGIVVDNEKIWLSVPGYGPAVLISPHVAGILRRHGAPPPPHMRL